MLFEVGETVVYPHHGAATITEVKKRTIKGEEKIYLKLNVTQGDLTIEVPAENVDLVGVRDVIGREGLDAVFEVLRSPKSPPTGRVATRPTWRSWLLAMSSRSLKSFAICGVVTKTAVFPLGRSACLRKRVRFLFLS